MATNNGDYGLIVKESEEEKEFDKYVNLWLNGEISYDDIWDKRPEYKSSMIKRLANKLRLIKV